MDYKLIFYIILFTIFLFLLLVFFSIIDFNLNPTIHVPKLIQEVTVETFDNINKLDLLQEIKNMKLFPIDSFCERYLGKAGELEKACERLTKETCLQTNCCVYTNFEQCSAGSVLGPTFSKPGLEHYYYQNKMFT